MIRPNLSMMTTRPILVLLSLYLVTITARSQDASPVVNIGDPAPSLRLRAWLKGAPIQQFEKGKI